MRVLHVVPRISPQYGNWLEDDYFSVMQTDYEKVKRERSGMSGFNAMYAVRNRALTFLVKTGRSVDSPKRRRSVQSLQVSRDFDTSAWLKATSNPWPAFFSRWEVRDFLESLPWKERRVIVRLLDGDSFKTCSTAKSTAVYRFTDAQGATPIRRVAQDCGHTARTVLNLRESAKGLWRQLEANAGCLREAGPTAEQPAVNERNRKQPTVDAT